MHTEPLLDNGLTGGASYEVKRLKPSSSGFWLNPQTSPARLCERDPRRMTNTCTVCTDYKSSSLPSTTLIQLVL